MRHALSRATRLCPYLIDGILELDSNTAQRTARSVAIGRKHHLFVGFQTGGRAAAIACALIETAKLNGSIRRDGLLIHWPEFPTTRSPE